MNKVFRVELSGGNGCYCELELPAAPYELLDALERLQMPMDGKPDWDIMSAVYTAQAAVNTTRTVVQAVAPK